MLQIMEARPDWPMYVDVFELPSPRLASGSAIWSDMTSVDTTEQWREVSVDKHHTSDPTIRLPGFDLPCHTWSLMNCFQTGQDPCHANLHKWSLVQSPSCDCGQQQTMNHTVDTCPLAKFEGGLNPLHEADDDAVVCLESTATAALTHTHTHTRLATLCPGLPR